MAAKATAQGALSPAELEARGRALGQLGNLLMEREALRVGLAADERACREAQAAVEDEARAQEGSGTPGWFKPALFGMGGLVIALAAIRLASGDAIWALGLLVGLAIVALPFFVGQPAATTGAAKERLARAAAAYTDTTTRIKALVEQIVKLATELGLSAAAEGHELARAQQALAKDMALLDQRAEAGKALEEAQKEAGVLAARQAELQRAADAAAKDLTQVEAAWTGWKEAAGLPAHLTAPGVIDVFQAISQGQAEVRARDEALAEAARYDELGRTYLTQVGELLARLELPAPTSLLALSAALEGAKARCEAARTAAQRREHLEAQLVELEDARARAQKALATAEGALAELLQEAGAKDEGEFRQRAEVFDERRSLRARADAARRAVDLRLGTSARAEGLRAELAAADPDRWPRELEALRQEAVALSARRDEAIERRHDAANARERLERATDIPALEAELETVRAALAAAVREWRVLTLAEGLVSETLARFERERQPAVLAHAATLFGQVTDGAYPRLRQHERGIVAVDRVEGEREAEHLSRGTREQLYLCIRMGLCHEFAGHSAALPLVMDDVLVNFDAERAEAVGRMLVAAAREQQILLFTCQPHTRELLRALSPDVHVVELPRYAGAQVPAAVPLSATPRDAGRSLVSSVPVADQPPSVVAMKLLSTLQEAGEALGKGPWLEAAMVAPDDWPIAIKELTDRGLVASNGKGRGTTYAVVALLSEERSPFTPSEEATEEPAIS